MSQVVYAFTEYPTFTKAKLISRYTEVVMMLAQHKTYIGQIRADEHRAKEKGFWDDNNASVAARQRVADFQAMEITATIMEEQGQIDTLTEERFLIEHLLEWGAYADAIV